MNPSLIANLNGAQKRALLSTEGPNLILAGAGSGKTRVLTHKVAYLMHEKRISGTNILMVTFTNKAANEMKERIYQLVSETSGGADSVQYPRSGTFHSLSARMLRVDGKHIGIPDNFVIYDDTDTLDAIKVIMKVHNISVKQYSPHAIRATISQAKNELISETEYPQYARGHFQETAAQIYREYQKLLKENIALDFDDLMFDTVRLLTRHPETLHKYQNSFQYILVDEYQDTNKAQYTITKLLSGRYRNITVVGDASQSIYAWRGADYKNILNFKEDFPEAKVFNLEQNYRSTQTILDGAFAVISKNANHPILKLWTDNPPGESIQLYEARSEQDEAKYIIRQVQKTIAEHPESSYSSFVVLYRTNAQSRVLEEVFLHHGIPYILVGGVRFYERKEIKDVISYLRILANPKDMIAYKRIEKLGKRRLLTFLEFAHTFTEKDYSTLEILDKTLEATDYLSLYDKNIEEDLLRLENIKELRSVATEFPKLIDFLENVSLVEQEYLPDNKTGFKRNGKSGNHNAITLMTLHAAKGLEFPVVFVVGMEEGIFPHSRALMDREQLEEERRLCYVGMTRAKLKLYLLYASQRLYFGSRQSNIVSRFVLDLPSHIVSSPGAEHDFF